MNINESLSPWSFIQIPLSHKSDHHFVSWDTCVVRKFTNPAASYRSRFPGWLKSSVLLPAAYISKRTYFVGFDNVEAGKASPGSSKAKEWKSQVAHRATLIANKCGKIWFLDRSIFTQKNLEPNMEKPVMGVWLMVAVCGFRPCPPKRIKKVSPGLLSVDKNEASRNQISPKNHKTL